MWIIKSGLAQSVERLFYKIPGRRFRPQWFFSAFFFLLLVFFFAFIIVILNYCKVDYKVFIIRNNKLIYLSRMKSCLWGWSCYNYSLAQRPNSFKKNTYFSCYFVNHMKVRNLRNRLHGQYGVRVGVGFYFGRAWPTEVFKFVLSLGALITRTGTYARTHTGKRVHVLLITMALKQKQK